MREALQSFARLVSKWDARSIQAREADILIGNALPLKNIPAGTVVHNIELRPGKGAQMARSAGAQAQLVSREGGIALFENCHRARSEKYKLNAWPPLAKSVMSSTKTNLTAKRARLAGWERSRTIGGGVNESGGSTPHGGGEGKTSGRRHPVTWGQPHARPLPSQRVLAALP